MKAECSTAVPVWTVATEDVAVPNVLVEEGMTPARLAELRTVLATLAASPITMLEAHPMPNARNRDDGLSLHAASPLAKQLAELVSQAVKSAPTDSVAASGEVLYRMVVPASVAAQVGSGLVRNMPSKGAALGVHSALVNSTGIVGQATFVPVASKAAVAGAATGSAATAGVAAAGAGALTVAAPLVLMAIAVSVSAHADRQRQAAIERITDLLEQLHEQKLDDERSELGGCGDAIEKATSVLLDQGRIGPSLGLDSAVHAISKSTERARTRLTRWQAALAALPKGPVEIGALSKAFPGLDEEGGAFRAHLELARLAIALKRRVLVLQAVDHAQREGGNHPFEAFIRTLQDDERRVDQLERGISSVLHQLSTLELKPSSGFSNLMWTQGAVDGLLRVAYRLRALGDGLDEGAHAPDVVIEIERHRDGSLVVFPAIAA